MACNCPKNNVPTKTCLHWSRTENSEQDCWFYFFPFIQSNDSRGYCKHQHSASVARGPGWRGVLPLERGWHCLCGATRWHKELTGWMEYFTLIFTAGSRTKNDRLGSQEPRQDKERSSSISALLFSAFKSEECLSQARLPSQHLDHSRKLWLSSTKGSKKSVLFYLLFYLLCSSRHRIESFLYWEYTTEHVESCNISQRWMVQEYLRNALSFRRCYDLEMCHNAKSKVVINLILLFFP